MAAKTLPIIDIAPLLGYLPDETNPNKYNKIDDETDITLTNAISTVVGELYDACTNVGFFYIKSNVFDELPTLIANMEKYSHIFFNKELDIKQRIDMKTAGRAWRGFFQIGEEMTSSIPDVKEGIYLGTELPETNQKVIDGVPMHGRNVFPRTGNKIDNIDINTLPHSSFQYEEVEDDRLLKEFILTYMNFARTIGFAIVDGLSLALGLPRYGLRNVLFTDNEHSDPFNNTLLPNELYDPLCLFRIFNYPATKSYQEQFNKLGYITPNNQINTTTTTNNNNEMVTTTMTTTTETTPKALYSVGEHTDYGGITILYQDNSGGLEVRDIKTSNFIPAPPLENTLVINIGDCFEKMTNGLFVSTPHRVINARQGDRISFPFFFDPSFNSKLTSLTTIAPKLIETFNNNNNNTNNDNEQQPQKTYQHNQTYQRWDNKAIGLQDFNGTYGNYILSKVAKVFPQLAQQVQLPDDQ